MIICRGSVGFLTRYDEDIREPLVQYQVSQVSMRVARGSASWLSSVARGSASWLSSHGSPTHVARLEFPRETGLILRCAGKAGNPFQTTQGNQLSCREQERTRSSEEVVPGAWAGKQSRVISKLHRRLHSLYATPRGAQALCPEPTRLCPAGPPLPRGPSSTLCWSMLRPTYRNSYSSCLSLSWGPGWGHRPNAPDSPVRSCGHPPREGLEGRRPL